METISSLLPTALAGGGIISVLVAARWAWRARVIAQWARVVAFVLVLVAAGAAVGVVDLARLFVLVRLLAGAV